MLQTGQFSPSSRAAVMAGMPSLAEILDDLAGFGNSALNRFNSGYGERSRQQFRMTDTAAARFVTPPRPVERNPERLVVLDG
jgi:hypothetical protein